MTIVAKPVITYCQCVRREQTRKSSPLPRQRHLRRGLQRLLNEQRWRQGVRGAECPLWFPSVTSSEGSTAPLGDDALGKAFVIACV